MSFTRCGKSLDGGRFAFMERLDEMDAGTSWGAGDRSFLMLVFCVWFVSIRLHEYVYLFRRGLKCPGVSAGPVLSRAKASGLTRQLTDGRESSILTRLDTNRVGTPSAIVFLLSWPVMVRFCLSKCILKVMSLPEHLAGWGESWICTRTPGPGGAGTTGTRAIVRTFCRSE
jgi:hypothetical protein